MMWTIPTKKMKKRHLEYFSLTGLNRLNRCKECKTDNIHPDFNSEKNRQYLCSIQNHFIKLFCFKILPDAMCNEISDAKDQKLYFYGFIIIPGYIRQCNSLEMQRNKKCVYYHSSFDYDLYFCYELNE